MYAIVSCIYIYTYIYASTPGNGHSSESNMLK